MIADAGLGRDDIDEVILATDTPEFWTPDPAAFLHRWPCGGSIDGTGELGRPGSAHRLRCRLSLGGRRHPVLITDCQITWDTAIGELAVGLEPTTC
ncbi:MAG: hypothetical protein R6X29_07960 [Acidimicrobiia bacterium]